MYISVVYEHIRWAGLRLILKGDHTSTKEEIPGHIASSEDIKAASKNLEHVADALIPQSTKEL